MSLVINAILIVLKILIAIGDYVRFLIGFFFKKLRNGFLDGITLPVRFFQTTLQGVRLLHKKIASKPKPAKRQKLQIVAKKHHAAKYSLPLFTFKKPHFILFHKHRRKRKKVRLPVPILAKTKYFIGGSLFSFFFIFIPMVVYIFLQSLPNPTQLMITQAPQTTKIYDRNGILLYQMYANQNRTLVTLNAIPQSLKQATIAIEDKKFYESPGFDATAIVRSALADVSGKPLQGGSTITQQLIKSTLLTPEKSFDRKIKELILAFWAQRIYTKDQILQMYFNQVAYGGTAYGVQAAAQTYFGKDVNDLNLSESAFLAGLPQAPTTYSPYGDHPDLWKKRQSDVLDRMIDLRYITRAQAEDAKQQQLQFQTEQRPIHAPHFVMYVRGYLIKKYGEPFVERDGLTVTTSLDMKTQDMAQKIVTDEVNNDAYLNLTNAAALVTNPKNGDILAMVGGKNYDDPNGGANNLTTALRQPGSSIKVVTYSAAMGRGLTAASILDDSPVNYNGYAPVNYDGRFHGRIPLRIALANSFNIPAVKTLNQIGVDAMVAQARKMGITTWDDTSRFGLSITLGGVEAKMTDMATVYGTLANLGKRVDLNPILKITDYQGHVIEEKKDVDGPQVMDAGVAYVLSNILADNSSRTLEFGPNSPLLIQGHTVSVKTGTTDYKRDNWTFGYTPDHLVAVWVGNNDNSPMSQALASGITGAAPIWHTIMSNLLEKSDQGREQFPMPANVVVKNCFGHPEYFVKGTENSISCNPLPSFTPSETKKP